MLLCWLVVLFVGVLLVVDFVGWWWRLSLVVGQSLVAVDIAQALLLLFGWCWSLWSTLCEVEGDVQFAIDKSSVVDDGDGHWAKSGRQAHRFVSFPCVCYAISI